MHSKEIIVRGFCAESDQFIEDHWLNGSDSAQNDPVEIYFTLVCYYVL